MITIGEFSYATGISITTLRYYDEVGLLPPGHVDPFTGYRHYQAAQLKEAALLRVLRASGMRITQMKEALTHPTALSDIITERRRELAAQRQLEDRALEAAAQWQAPLTTHSVTTRKCPATPWAGVRTCLDMKDVTDEQSSAALEELTSACEDAYERLIAELHTAGLLHEGLDDGTAGAESAVHTNGWTGMDTDARRPSVVTLTLAVELSDELPADYTPTIALPADVAIVSGTLPARREAVVSSPLSSEVGNAGANDPDEWQDALPGGRLPQRGAMELALFAEQHDVPSTSVRQHIIHESGAAHLQLALTLEPLPAA